MSLLFWVAAVVALLGVLILVHELGHFVFAKLFDVRVMRFSLGFGPRLLGFTRGETEYRLSLVPLGGYVRLLGEDPSEAIPAADRERHRALSDKPLWQRYTIVIAGPVFNLLLAAADLLRALHRPAHAAAADHRIGAAEPAGRRGRAGAR